MKIISFAWTTAAFRANRKTVTRREWNERYAKSFFVGEEIQAWDRTPRIKGAKRIGTIQLTQVPYLENTFYMPGEDYEGEGFKFYDEHPELLPKRWQGGSMNDRFWDWQLEQDLMWVVRFRITEIFEPLVLEEAVVEPQGRLL